MLATTRRANIVQIVRARQAVTNQELAHELNVSVETVRRDIHQLHREGAVTRVRGGVTRQGFAVSEEAPHAARRDTASEEKMSIGRIAAQIVKDASTVFVDTGTTATAVALEMSRTFSGTVITPSLWVAQIFAESGLADVILPGGIVKGDDRTVVGPIAQKFFKGVHPDVAFIGTGGIDIEAGVTDFDLFQGEDKRLIIEQSVKPYALAASGKFGIRAPYRVCGLDEVTAILTDAALDDRVRALYEASDIAIFTDPSELQAEAES